MRHEDCWSGAGGGRLRPSSSCRRAAMGLLALSALWLPAGCRREEVTHARVAKEQAAPAPPAAMGGSMAGDVPPPPSTGKNPLRWTLPKGWTESLSGGMRYATLKPPVSGRVEGSVVVLPGPAGGELANVNRWRGQIGLAPMDEATLASARKVIESKAGSVAVYDFTSEGQKKSRVVAGVAVAAGNSWFLKLAGDAEPVAAARADFIRLLESLRLEEAN